ncbi:hypothetical protein LOAG_05465 [Loa loa]|uniref:Uncharacterized protein n=1 Tax=Loa loa TaxID=7209 RepID=A0A1S0U0Q3_LOALO|nr:hypothetical protein LOAG_05465 [Loa loa]EFO23019.1 hypothetical protein LOAG_05465 [Loa loa]
MATKRNRACVNAISGLARYVRTFSSNGSRLCCGTVILSKMYGADRKWRPQQTYRNFYNKRTSGKRAESEDCSISMKKKEEEEEKNLVRTSLLFRCLNIPLTFYKMH